MIAVPLANDITHRRHEGEHDNMLNHAVMMYGRLVSPEAVTDFDALCETVSAWAEANEIPVSIVTPNLLEEPNEFDDYCIGVVAAAVKEAYRPVAIEPSIFEREHAGTLDRLWAALDNLPHKSTGWFAVPAGWCGLHIVAGKLSPFDDDDEDEEEYDDPDDGDWEEHSIKGEEFITVCAEDTTNIHTLTESDIAKFRAATETVFMECHYI